MRVRLTLAPGARLKPPIRTYGLVPVPCGPDVVPEALVRETLAGDRLSRINFKGPFMVTEPVLVKVATCVTLVVRGVTT